jgi:glutamine phosphoribosylpyrophosphate amidotransferase
MCGIILTNSKTLLTTKLYEQIHRGTKGAGFMTSKEVMKSKNIFEVVTNLPDEGIIAFHHRIPTSTSNTDDTAHPFESPNHKGWWGMHNGVIYNPQDVIPNDLKNTNWWVGNDSQAIVWEAINAIVNNYNGNTIIERKSYGYASLFIMSPDGQFYCYRDQNQPDLFLSISQDKFIISSEEMNGKEFMLIPKNTFYKISPFGELEEMFTWNTPEQDNQIDIDYSLTGGKKKQVTYNYANYNYFGETNSVIETEFENITKGLNSHLIDEWLMLEWKGKYIEEEVLLEVVESGYIKTNKEAKEYIQLNGYTKKEMGIHL